MRPSDLHTWAHCLAKKGDKIDYANCQPCRKRGLALMARELTEQGIITTTSKKTFVQGKPEWVATAIRL